MIRDFNKIYIITDVYLETFLAFLNLEKLLSIGNCVDIKFLRFITKIVTLKLMVARVIDYHLLRRIQNGNSRLPYMHTNNTREMKPLY